MSKQPFLDTYGSTVREYRDDPGYQEFRDTPRYQDTSSSSFMVLCSQIGDNVLKISSGANALEKNMRLLGGENDSIELRDKIHSTSQRTKVTVSETTALMKQLAKTRRLTREQSFQWERLKNDFQESVQRFTDLQKRVAEKVKTSVKLRPEKQKIKEAFDWNEVEDDDDSVAFVEREQRKEQQLQQEQIIEDDLALIQDREERIRQLEGDILDVNEIFRELGVMIHEQGEVIDSIEANVIVTETNVEAGTSSLGKALGYQKKSRKKMCIILVIFLVIITIIAIIIATEVK